MNNKFVALIVIWVIVILSYLTMAVIMPAGQELVTQAVTDLEASANMSNFPGTLGMVESSPVWIWILPGLVGVIFTVVTLKSNDERR